MLETIRSGLYTYWNIFDAREHALIIWTSLLLLYAFFKVKGLRKTLKRLIKIFLNKKTLIPWIFMGLYIAGTIYALKQLHYWEISLLKDTLIWCIFVAPLLIINSATKKNFFTDSVLHLLRASLLLEFIIAFYPYNFWIEMVLMPFITLLMLTEVIPSKDIQSKQVKSCLNYVLAIIGFTLLGTSLQKLITSSDFLSISFIKEMVLVPILTLAMLPALYILALYSSYELLFIRMNRFCEKENWRKVKLQALCRYNINLKKLNAFSIGDPREKVKELMSSSCTHQDI